MQHGGDIRHLQLRIARWADEKFPNRTIQDVLIKVFEELGEYIREPSARHEIADVMILVLDAAHLAGIHDVDDAIREKMEINEKRSWKLDPQTRIMRHEQ